MYAKKSVSMKVVVLLLAVVLLIGCVAGGTLAYLMAKSSTVTNTFVAGEIGTLTLTEQNGTSTTGMSNIKIIPGVDIAKDPVVTFKDYNVDAYVFLKVDASNWTVTGNDTNGYKYDANNDDKMTWTLVGWNKLDDGVYYKTVAANAGEQTWHIINEGLTVEIGEGENKKTVSIQDKILVSHTITNTSAYAKGLTFTAYAIQQDTFEDDAEGTENGKTAVQKAWDVAKTVTN